MGALGWLQNLDFAGGSSGKVYQTSVLCLATNNTGTNVWIQIESIPTNANFTTTVVHWRELHRNKLSNVSSNRLNTTGSMLLNNLSANLPYEVWGTPIIGDHVSVKSNTIKFYPTDGSHREKILNSVALSCRDALSSEVDLLRQFQIQIGHRRFRGKFRGIYGVILIDGDTTNIEPYTNDASKITYSVTVHFGWQDMRRTVREDQIGRAAELLRKLLSASQDKSLPELITVTVNDIPFETEVFGAGHNVRGFSLQVDYEYQECLTAI